MMRIAWAIGLGALLGNAALAQTTTPQQPAAETAPQSGASTAMKPAAGVSSPTDVETKSGNGKCKSASAEMTNGAVTTCKQ